MKIFVSWSGNRSKAVAEILCDWLKCVIQATKPWISTRDIDRGALWFTEINDQLKDTSVGIVCLTHENVNRPWILFEAGALAKGLSSNRVCTFLIDLKPADLEDPLAQFNHTLPERDSIWALVKTLNGCMAASALDERILDQIFNTYWGQFEQKFKAVLKQHPLTEKVEPRSKENLLEEILENTRAMNHRIRRLESAQEGDLFGRDSDLENRHMRVREMHLMRLRDYVASGRPPEQIIERMSRYLPMSVIMAELGRMRESVSQASKDTEASKA